jgi:hypothetical protein
MAAPTAPSAAPAAGGNWFSRKTGPLPNWAYIGIGAAALLAWYLWQRSQASSAATAGTTGASTTPSTSTGPTTGFGVGGYGGSGGGTQPGSGVNPGGPMQPYPPASGAIPNPGTTTGSTTTLPFQMQSGSGWWTGSPQSAANTIITDANGNQYEWIDGPEYQGLVNTGATIYFEALPGVFLPVPAGLKGLAGATPLYVQVPGGTPANPAAPASTGGTATTAGSTAA